VTVTLVYFHHRSFERAFGQGPFDTTLRHNRAVSDESFRALDLFRAIEAGAGDRVTALLDAEPSLASARDAHGVSAVRFARYRGHTAIVDTLVATGADLDVFDAACVGDTTRLAGLLEDLDARADLVDAFSGDGFSPLQLACFFGHLDAARLLVAQGAPTATVSTNDMVIHALNAAAAGGHAGIVALLLDAGADPDAPQHAGWTPLMSAAANGDATTLDVLLEHGADPRARADDGSDAAALADQRGHPELAGRLRDLTP
jgi:ankyrin repeat protein